MPKRNKVERLKQNIMTYFDFIFKIQYNKAQLRTLGIEPKEILVNDLDLTKLEDPMFSIWLYESICGLKVIRTDELEINDFRIILPKY